MRTSTYALALVVATTVVHATKLDKELATLSDIMSRGVHDEAYKVESKGTCVDTNTEERCAGFKEEGICENADDLKLATVRFYRKARKSCTATCELCPDKDGPPNFQPNAYCEANAAGDVAWACTQKTWIGKFCANQCAANEKARSKAGLDPLKNEYLNGCWHRMCKEGAACNDYSQGDSMARMLWDGSTNIRIFFPLDTEWKGTFDPNTGHFKACTGTGADDKAACAAASSIAPGVIEAEYTYPQVSFPNGAVWVKDPYGIGKNCRHVQSATEKMQSDGIASYIAPARKAYHEGTGGTGGTPIPSTGKVEAAPAVPEGEMTKWQRPGLSAQLYQTDDDLITIIVDLTKPDVSQNTYSGERFGSVLHITSVNGNVLDAPIKATYSAGTITWPNGAVWTASVDEDEAASPDLTEP
jgi:hypothetical protein